MRNLRPSAVYVVDGVLGNSHAKKRLLAFREKITTDTVKNVSYEQLDKMAASNKWDAGLSKRTGTVRTARDPILVFDMFRWYSEEQSKQLQQVYPHLKHTFFGSNYATVRQKQHLAKQGVVCKTAIELHIAFGCIQRCQYCHTSDVLNIMLNVEELPNKIDELIKLKPEQRLYKCDSWTDTIALEPELGVSQVLVPYFSQLSDKYLLLYTKSDNIDHLLHLEHCSKTIISWTISSPTVAHKIEDFTPSTASRIAAMKKCQDAGYRVRCRFQPIVPIVGWQADNKRMIEMMADSGVKPDVFALKSLSHMRANDLNKVFEEGLLHPQFIQNAVDASPLGISSGPICEEDRIKIYKHITSLLQKYFPDTPIALCTETGKVWRAMSPILGVNAHNYVCVCGPDCTPPLL